jgi:hypothetical protein
MAYCTMALFFTWLPVHASSAVSISPLPGFPVCAAAFRERRLALAAILACMRAVRVGALGSTDDGRFLCRCGLLPYCLPRRYSTCTAFFSNLILLCAAVDGERATHGCGGG